MFVWYADSVKKEAREIYSNVREKGCKVCPCREWCGEIFGQCRLNILRELQTRYDYQIDLQQVTGIY
ncbi:MAG: hypothetical protein IJG24_01755 [Selenomonadaceae bacterium]|nr:hypothetical protein [Selenomonadaceae bacterium]